MATAVKKTSGKPRVGDGTPGPGRPKGVPNKTTKAAKEAIAEAAERIGGTDRLVEWIKADAKNESAFWAGIYPKLLPLQVAGDPDQPVAITITREFVDRAQA